MDERKRAIAKARAAREPEGCLVCGAPIDTKTQNEDGSADIPAMNHLPGHLDDRAVAWICAYAEKTGQSVRKVVVEAIKHYRHMIEDGEDPK